MHDLQRITPSFDDRNKEIDGGVVERLKNRKRGSLRIRGAGGDFGHQVVHDMEDGCLHVVETAECIVHR